ncbi:hypothetical protein [Paenibacillus sp. HJGM_3]
MELIRRGLSFPEDREVVLDFHCEVNYACDSEWARRTDYAVYRQK